MTEQELDALLFIGSEPIINQTKQTELKPVIKDNEPSEFVKKWFHSYQPAKQTFNSNEFPSLDC
jgi:hypothetical protein